MLTCEQVHGFFSEHGFDFFTGVADSTFKPWMSYLDAMDGQGLTNRIVPIERDAIAVASAYHVATGKVGVVYTQNSGLGNTINPLVSLAHRSVYDIPILMMVGWRGRPGHPDEPQHAKMGNITLRMLDLLDVGHTVLPDDPDGAREAIQRAREHIDSTGESFALIIGEGTFASFKGPPTGDPTLALGREQVIQAVANRVSHDALVVATTGKAGRELYEFRQRTGGGDADFLMIGAMGTASTFAMELALQRPDRPVVVLDGDGAALMSAGAFSSVGYYAPANLTHILIDNGVHESTGAQPTTSSAVQFDQIALASGYTSAAVVETQEQLDQALADLGAEPGPSMLVVRVRPGSRSDLGRPDHTPIEMKQRLMANLGSADQ